MRSSSFSGLLGPVAELGEDRRRLVFARDLIQAGIVGLVGRVAADAGRHHAVGREHAAAPHLLGEEVAVDRHGDGAAELRVAPRLLVQLDRVVIGAEIGADMHLVAELRAEVRELLGRQVVVGIELARLEALDRGGAVRGRDKSSRHRASRSAASWNFGFLTIVTWSFGTHSASVNAPFETRLPGFVHAAPNFSTVARCTG